MKLLNTKALKKLIALIFAISFFGQTHSQKNKLNHGVIGHWSTKIDNDWQQHLAKAQWVWMSKSTEADCMLARKNFDVTKIPNIALLSITASSKYELFINGKSICQGPARSAPHHQSYDVLDITSILKKGKNNLSVKVHHQKNKHSYNHLGRAGLLAQLNFDNKVFITTNKSWKATTDPSWNSKAPTMNRFQMVVNDRVDLRKKHINWNKIDFNDNSWNNAFPLLRNSGWPSPKKNETAYALTNPWVKLVQRDIPYLIEKNVKAVQIIQAQIIENNTSNPIPSNKIILTGAIDDKLKKTLNTYSKKEKSLIIPANKKNNTSILIFDFDRILNGMPILNIKGESGTEVQVLSAPFVVNKTFSQKIVDSEYLDKIILSGKNDTWQSMYFKPTRYLALAIKGNSKPVEIDYFGIHQIQYPFNNTGSISVPKATWIEKYWEASKLTIDVTTTDAMTDNYRERRQYAQTGYYAALGNYWTFGDTALQRRYLLMTAQEQFANGIMPAYAPLASDDYMVILDSNCLWIRSLYNYYLYSDDEETLDVLLPYAKKMMALLHSFTDKNGLLYNPPYAYWLDHTLNDRTGANLCLNGHYLGALEDFQKILSWKKDPGNETFSQRAIRLKKALSKNFWNARKGLFVDAIVDGKQSEKFSEHGNAMALTHKIGTEQQTKIVSETILKSDSNDFVKRENGMTMVSPAMSYFLHFGLAENGYAEESLKLFNKRFSKMLAPNTNGTLWEEWWRDGSGRTGKFIGGRTRSDAQTESAFPPDLFVKYILGIKVTKPGMKEITISKPKYILENSKATLPSPQGIINIHWFHEKSLNIDIPSGIEIKIDLKSFNSPETVLINKKKTNTKNEQYINLNSGKQEVVF